MKFPRNASIRAVGAVEGAGGCPRIRFHNTFQAGTVCFSLRAFPSAPCFSASRAVSVSSRRMAAISCWLSFSRRTSRPTSHAKSPAMPSSRVSRARIGRRAAKRFIPDSSPTCSRILPGCLSEVVALRFRQRPFCYAKSDGFDSTPLYGEWHFLSLDLCGQERSRFVVQKFFPFWRRQKLLQGFLLLCFRFLLKMVRIPFTVTHAVVQVHTRSFRTTAERIASDNQERNAANDFNRL